MKKILYFLLFAFIATTTQARVITSTSTGGNWGSTGTWGTGVVPGSTDTAIIATSSGNSVTVNVTETVLKITINSSATLTISSALAVDGLLTNNGSVGGSGSLYLKASNGTVLSGGGSWTSNTGTIFFEGSTQTIDASVSLSKSTGGIKLYTSGLGGNVKVTNNGSITLSDVNLGYVINSGSTYSTVWINAASSYLSVAAPSFTTTKDTLYASATGNTVVFGSSSTIILMSPKSNTFYNLVIGGTGIQSMPNNYSAYSVTVNSGAELNMSGDSLFLSGSWTNSGTVINHQRSYADTAIVKVSSTIVQKVPPTGLKITSTSTGTIWGSASCWVNGLIPGLIDTAIIATTSGYTMTSGGGTVYKVIVNSGATLGGDLTISSILINNGTVSASGLIFTGSNQTVLSGGGAWSSAGSLEFEGMNQVIDASANNIEANILKLDNLTISGEVKVRNKGKITLTNHSIGALVSTTSSYAAVWINDTNSYLKVLLVSLTNSKDTLYANAPGNTIEYGGNSSYTMKKPVNSTYYNLTTSDTNTAKLPAALTVTNNLKISVGTLDVTTSNYGLTIGSNFTDNGTFTQRSGTVTFNGSANQQLNGSSTPTFYNLTENQVASTDSTFLNAAVTVSNTLTTTQGMLDCQKHQLTNSVTPVVSLSPSSATICNGSSTMLSASNYSNYLWFPSTGLSSTNSSSISAYPTTTTTYTVYGNNSHTCTCGVGTDEITVNATPTVTISPSAPSYCIGGSTLLTASGASTYSWSPSIGLSATAGATITANPTSTTTYTVTGTGTDGCTAAQTVTVTVNPLPIISITTSTPSICLSTSAPLSAGGALTYTWSPSTGLSATTGSSVFADPSATAIYTLTGTDVHGCVNSSSQTITVNSCVGSTCGNPRILPLQDSLYNDTLPIASSKWYSITAVREVLIFTVYKNSGSPGTITRLQLYDSCGGSLLMQVHGNSTQDSISLIDTNITSHTTFYVKVSTDSVGTSHYKVRYHSTVYPNYGTYTYIDCSYTGYNGDPFITSCGPDPTLAKDQNGTIDACEIDVCTSTIITVTASSIYFSTIPPPLYWLLIDNVSGTYITPPTNSMLFARTGSWTIEFNTAPDGSGTAYDAMLINVYPTPTPSFVVSPSSTSICYGTPITVTKTDNFETLLSTYPYYLYYPNVYDYSWSDTYQHADGLLAVSPYYPAHDVSTYSVNSCDVTYPGGNYPINLIETYGGDLTTYQATTFYDPAGKDETTVVTGCAASASVDPTINDLSPSFTLGYLCNNSSNVSFTNTSSCPDPTSSYYNWQWYINGSPYYNGPTPPSANLAPSSSTYTVTLSVNPTYSSCSTYVKSTTENIMVYAPLSESITGPSLTCTSSTFDYCASISGGSGSFSSGTWTVTGGTYTLTTTSGCNSSISAVFSSSADGGTVTYSTTDEVTGCTVSQTFDVAGCCSVSNTAVLDNQNISTLSSTFLSTYSSNITAVWPPIYVFQSFDGSSPNPSLNINGTLTVDEDLEIDCSDILMGSYGQIVVPNGSNLTLYNCHLHACDNMWNGIYVEPGGSLTLNGSLIEDAQNAVDLPNDGATLNCLNTIFNKNYIGISINNVSTFSGYIKGCTFSSYASLGSPCPTSGPNLSINTSSPATLVAPYTGYRSSIGIAISSTNSITVGSTSSGSANTFNYLDCGIYSRASNSIVINNIFENIGASPYANGGATCTGVYAMGDASGDYTVTVGGSSSVDDNTFTNCQIGVQLGDTVNAVIEGNSFDAGTSTSFYDGAKPQGIFVMDNFETNIAAFDNNINNYATGIYSIGDLNTTEHYYGNTINGGSVWSGYPNTGIWVSDDLPSTGSYVGIGVTITETGSANTISNVDNGIVCNSLQGSTKVENNVINLDALGGSSCIPCNVGIYIDNSFNTNVISNSVTQASSSVIGDGIRVEAGNSGNLITCNTVTGFDNGLLFYGPQTPYTRVDQNSLNTYNNGLHLTGSGTIGPQGDASYSTDNTWSDYLSTSSNWATYVDNGSNPSGNPTAFYVNPTTSGVTNYPANNGNGTLASAISFTGNGMPDCFDCFDQFICSGDGGGHRRINKYPLNDSIIFPVSKATALSIINNSAQFTLMPRSSHWREKYTLFRYLSDVDSSLLDSSVVIRAFLDSSIHANMGGIEKINRILTDTNGITPVNISKASNLINSLSNPDTIESTSKTVYGILITMKSKMRNSPDSLQASILRTIAPLCPLQYGNAVLTARALLRHIDHVNYYNTCEISSAREHIRKINPDGSISKSTTNIYPDPANSMVTVEAEIQPGEVYHCCLYNDMGQVIKCIDINSSLTFINVEGLSSGLYYCRITDNQGNSIASQKLMVIH